MKLSVYVSGSLAYVLDLGEPGTHEVEMPNEETTLGKALSYLAQHWNPKLAGTVIDGDGRNLGRHVVVSVNNLSIALLQGLDTPLGPHDQVNLGLYSPSAGG